MKPFEARSKCVKCGGTDAAATFCASTAGKAPAGSELPERIERHCNRCGYDWDEAPLDAERVPLTASL